MTISSFHCLNPNFYKSIIRHQHACVMHFIACEIVLHDISEIELRTSNINSNVFQLTFPCLGLLNSCYASDIKLG
jgi:hypothetical protein